QGAGDGRQLVGIGIAVHLIHDPPRLVHSAKPRRVAVFGPDVQLLDGIGLLVGEHAGALLRVSDRLVRVDEVDVGDKPGQYRDEEQRGSSAAYHYDLLRRDQLTMPATTTSAGTTATENQKTAFN